MSRTERRSWTAALAAAVALAASSALAAPPDGVTFYAGFENTIDGVAPGGPVKGDPGNAPAAYQPGLRGQALLAGDGGPFVQYPGAGLATTPEGSVELWFKAQNWTLPAWGFHVFFRAEGEPGGTMLLYKYGHASGRLMAYVADPAAKKPMLSGDPPVRFNPDVWHQLVMTWAPAGVTFYYDGEPCRISQDGQPVSFRVKSFSVGDDAWSGASKGAKEPEWRDAATNRNAKTLLDEVYLYNRALSAEEAAWAFKNAAKREPGKDIPSSVSPALEKLDLTPLPDKGAIGFEARLPARRRGEAARIRVEIVKPAELKAAADFPFDAKGEAKGEVPCARFPQGMFELKGAVLDGAGKAVGDRTASFEAPAPPVWRGNRLGFSDTPPEPYTPIEPLKEGVGFNCLGRTVVLDEMGFVKNVTSQGQEVMASPMNLAARIKGKPVVWRDKRIQIKERDANHLVWTSRAVSDLGRLEAVITADYDGMIRYDLTLTPEGQQTVDALELELPVRRECATMNCVPVGRGGVFATFDEWVAAQAADPRSGATASAARMDFPWAMYAWLGGDDAGLSAVVESDQAWDAAGRKDALCFERSADAVKIVMSFCKEAWTLPSPWRLTVGVQPTPVKTLVPRGQWRHGRGPEQVPGANFWIYWTNPKEMPAFGYPGVKSVKDFLKIVEDYGGRGTGVGIVPYSLLTQFSIQAPEYDFYFSRLWPQGTRIYATAMDIAAFGPRSATVRIAPVKDYVDYLVWKNHEWMTQCRLAGVYHDLTSVYEFAMPDLGLGYQRGAEWRPAQPVFAVRELYRRMYTMGRALAAADGKPRLSIIHARPEAWIAAYCDFNWVGEYLKEDYRRAFKPDAETRTNAGHAIGFRCLWLPQQSATGCHNRRPGGPEQPSRYLAGMLLLHDMNCSPNYMHEAVLRDFYTALDKFGDLSAARFVPYWKSQGLKVDGDKTLCSAYVRGPGAPGVLLCVVNTTDASQTAEIGVDLKALGAAPCSKATELSTGQPIAFENARLRLPVGPHEYRLVHLAP